jgi:O-antigen biosynthesis protein
VKIYFIQGDYNFCYYYRGYLPGVYSNNYVVADFLQGATSLSGEQMKERAMKCDVICFQRPSGKAALDLAKVLKKAGKYIIFDNDDTYAGVPLHRLENEKQVEVAKEINARLNEFCAFADGVTTTTQVLADEYSQWNPNVAILKNCIDPVDEFLCKKNDTSKFRIGFIGSVTSNDDYFHIKEQIRELDARGDVTIVILGVKRQDGKLMASTMKEDYDFWVTLKNIEWHNAVNVTEFMYTLSQLALDLAIIPRKDHYFNKCKSNLKFLEMSLLKIPVLAQSFPDGLSPYEQDKNYCTLVTDDSKWYSTIITIKDNYAPYKNLALKAHDYVLKEYNIKTYAQEWVKQIENLCKSAKKS